MRTIPTQTSSPNGQSSEQWNSIPLGTGSDNYSFIDETIALKDNTDYVYAIGVAPGLQDVYTFPADLPGDALEVTKICFELYVNGIDIAGEPGVRITLIYDGGDQEQRTFDVTTAGAWRVASCDMGPLSLSPAQYNAMTIRFNAAGGAGGVIPVWLT